MQRVVVIGPGGSGKSTLAKRIGESLGLPVIHLDREYWRPGWVATPTAEWKERIAQLTARPAWVMDGNYGGTMEARLRAADTVVFLDLPRTTCLRRAVSRWLRYRGRSRPDMASDCPEKLTWEFIRWIWTYPRRRRPGVMAQLDAIAKEKRVVVLGSARAVAAFLADLSVPASPSPVSSSRR
ncbi:MAG: DNA topology modulation protein [Gemmatimonadota bacterium]|nr:DNA topology modulation protein [Gemmatimonadota bacterium]